MSPAFELAHPVLASIIKGKAREGTTKCTFAKDKAHVLTVGSKRIAGGKGNEVMIFVTAIEKTLEDR